MSSGTFLGNMARNPISYFAPAIGATMEFKARSKRKADEQLRADQDATTKAQKEAQDKIAAEKVANEEQQKKRQAAIVSTTSSGYTTGGSTARSFLLRF